MSDCSSSSNFISRRTHYLKKDTLWWGHNERNGVSNHQSHECLPNRLFWHRWKKTSKIRVTGLCEGNSPVTMNSPHKGPVTRKILPFDDVIMTWKSINPRYFEETNMDPENKKDCIQGVKHNILKMFQFVCCVIADLSWKNQENPFIYFPVMSVTDIMPRLVRER